jgi:predicted metal-dependent phosphoesterase TrpH
VVIDLHTHSNASDGSDEPAAIVALAQAAGCTAVALTDHDTLAGIDEAQAEADRRGVRLVPGCELSCEWPHGTMHLLVYFVAPGPGALQDELARLQQLRLDRNHRLVERLVDLGLPISYDEISAEAGGDGIGRPHVAAVLVRKGVVGSIQEAFDVWLAKGQPGYVERDRLTPERAVELARASAGVPVVAHPLSLGLAGAALGEAVSHLAGVGVQGLEATYGRYSPAERNLVAGLAADHGLVATGGSDHHGTYKPDLSIGIGRGDLDVPEAVLDELESRRP